jgi:hypothetical protein
VGDPTQQEDSIKDHKAIIRCLEKKEAAALREVSRQDLTRG